MSRSHIYVGLDVHKETIAVAIADHRRNGEVRFWGNIPNTPGEVQQLLKMLTTKHKTLEVSYEAGPCGYALYRQFTGHGVPCQVVAPSRLLRRPGERIKNDHRDAVTLARLARAGELTAVWVPEPAHEAVRDLVRARHAANRDLRQARLRIQSFLLKHDVRYPKKAWTYRHRVWLADRRFAHPAQQLTFQHYLNTEEQALARRTQLETHLRELLPSWSLTPLVQALQGLRGVGLIIAATVLAEVGDLTRFDSPKQLMAFLGLTPGEYSSGSKTRPRGITKLGNPTVRALLYEAAWNYQRTPKVGSYMRAHLPPDLPQEVKDIAWKAQLRLHTRYRQLVGRGKKSQVAITAVARELVGFMWAIAQHPGLAPRSPDTQLAA
ncbi:MAG: IS110 family transposase [Nitrospira sp.]